MRSKAKRTLAVLVAALMCLTLFAACSGNQNGGSNTSAASSAATTAASSAATTAATTAAADVDDGSETFEYTWVGYSYNPITATGDDARIQKLIEKKYNIKLTQVFVDQNNYEELMNLKFASGDIPDVFKAGSAVMLGKWVAQGVIGELKRSDIQTYAPDVWTDIQDQAKYDPYVDKYTIIDGKNYGLQLTSPDSPYRAPVIWRTDWLKKVGINKIPETVDEFKDALTKFTHNDPDGNGKNDTYGMSATGMDAFWGTSGYIPGFWALRDGQVVYSNIQPEIKNVLALFAELYKDGVIDPEYVTGENQGGYWATSQPFCNGKIGLSCLGSYYHWNPPYFEDQDWTSTNGKLFKDTQGADATYDFGVPAVGADGKSGMASYSPATGITVIGVQMEDQPKKIQRFLKSQNGYCEDKDYYMNVRYGFEGEQYEIDSHGMYKYLGNADTPKEKTAEGMGGGFAFMNYNCIKWFKELYKPQYDFADKVAADHLITNAVGGSLPSQATYQTDLDTLWTTVSTNIITGEASVDTFDQYVTDWKAKGGDQLTKEANDWYNNIANATAE